MAHVMQEYKVITYVMYCREADISGENGGAAYDSDEEARRRAQEDEDEEDAFQPQLVHTPASPTHRLRPPQTAYLASQRVSPSASSVSSMPLPCTCLLT